MNIYTVANSCNYNCEMHRIGFDEDQKLVLLDHDIEEEETAIEMGERPCSCHSVGMRIQNDPNGNMLMGAEHSDTDLLKVSIDAGADVSYKDNKALFLAVLDGSAENIRLLVEHGADIHARRDAALTRAAALSNHEAAKVLIELGIPADINGHAPLYEARQSNDEEMAWLLLKRCPRKSIGRGVSIITVEGSTEEPFAWQIAEHFIKVDVFNNCYRLATDVNGNIFLVGDEYRDIKITNHIDLPKSEYEEWLNDLYDNINMIFEAAITIDDAEAVRFVLDAGMDPHYDNDFPIRYASNYGSSGIVELLLQAGADIHAYEDEPLRVAVYGGHSDTVKLLLENGADALGNSGTHIVTAAIKGYHDIYEMLTENCSNIKEVLFDALSSGLWRR